MKPASWTWGKRWAIESGNVGGGGGAIAKKFLGDDFNTLGQKGSWFLKNELDREETRGEEGKEIYVREGGET